MFSYLFLDCCCECCDLTESLFIIRDVFERDLVRETWKAEEFAAQLLVQLLSVYSCRVAVLYCADFEPLVLSPLTDNPFRLITMGKNMHLEMYVLRLKVDWCLG